MDDFNRPKLIKVCLEYMTLLFLALRACDVIDWPWYIVLLPTVIPAAFVAVVALCVGLCELVKKAKEP